MQKIIYKISPVMNWEEARQQKIYKGSAHDERDGFIHFSTASQLEGTLKKHYKGQQNLLLIAVNAEQLGAHLKFESARNGELFPHLYSDLSFDAVLWEKPIEVRHLDTGEEIHLLPEEVI